MINMVPPSAVLIIIAVIIIRWIYHTVTYTLLKLELCEAALRFTMPKLKLYEEELELYNQYYLRKEANSYIVSDHHAVEFINMCMMLNKPIECPVCYCQVQTANVCITTCGHVFCKECVSQIKAEFSALEPSVCAVCRKDV